MSKKQRHIFTSHLKGNKKDAIFDERYVKYQNKGLKENEEVI